MQNTAINQTKIRIAALAAGTALACAACLAVATPAHAATYTAKNADQLMSYAAQSGATVNLVKGKTYNLSRAIRMASGVTLNAKGATIVQKTANKGSVSHYVTKANYGSVKNVTINGGTWINNSSSSGLTVMRFAHATNVTVKNATIKDNYKSHAVEFIACKDSRVTNCTITATGKKYSTCGEEQVQIDIATKDTAPGVWNETHKAALVNNQTCKNITVSGCTISGSRGICANFNRGSKAITKYHTGIKILNNKVTGNTAEAVALFNTYSATVSGNTITTKAAKSRGSYSDGLAVRIMGKISAMKKGSITLSKNKVTGYRYGINVASLSGSSYGKVTVTSNKVKAKSGKGNAIKMSYHVANKYKVSKNKAL